MRRFRASLQDAVQYLITTSHGLIVVVLNYPRLQHPQLCVKVVLAGGAPSRSLRPAENRSSSSHDWDFFGVGVWAEVVIVLMGLFEILGQDPAFSTFKFGSLTFVFVFPGQECVRLQFILQAYYSLGKSASTLFNYALVLRSLTTLC